MTSQLRIPRHDEWEECARLLYISGPDLYTYIFIDREPKIYKLLHVFYRNPGLYSKDNIIVLEEDGKLTGLILGYPARDMKKLGKQMLGSIWAMLMASGPLKFSKMLLRFKLKPSEPKIS